VVRNDSDHCEAGHKNKCVVPETDKALRKIRGLFDLQGDESIQPESNGVDDLAPQPLAEGSKTGQFEEFGPMWQFECPWCGEMSDCFDSKTERDKAIADHRCGSEALYGRVKAELDTAKANPLSGGSSGRSCLAPCPVHPGPPGRCEEFPFTGNTSGGSIRRILSVVYRVRRQQALRIS
jgi:hypothetical protein